MIPKLSESTKNPKNEKNPTNLKNLKKKNHKITQNAPNTTPLPPQKNENKKKCPN